jgi:prepilin-type N-terminal cleavage/methylation domain-containing protein/prepilin-type processing-associated H-X9-DG protein
MKLRKRTECGFTLTELIVVVAAIAVVVAMLLPAIQRVREASNTIICSNNLRLLGQAVNQGLMSNSPYPTGGWAEAEADRSWVYHFVNGGPEIPSTGMNQRWGWAYQLLPQLGLNDQWELRAYFRADRPGASRPDLVQDIPVSYYVCPSRHRPKRVLRPSYGRGVAITDYAGNGGHLSFVNPTDGKNLWNRDTEYEWPFTSTNVKHTGTIGVARSAQYGRIVVDGELRPRDVIDGLSFTLLIGEKRINAALAGNSSHVGDAQPGDSLGFCSGFSTDTIRTGAFAPARDEADRSKPVADGFGAAHSNGFNALFADGSVRVIGYNATDSSAPGNLSVMQRLCHRSDGGLLPAWEAIE